MSFGSADAEQAFPLGAAVTLEQLDQDPHPILSRLRQTEPVSWLPALNGWLVTRYDLAVAVMRDSSTFTVEDPRFSTGQVIGPSMLSLDGDAHDRHRAPFGGPFRPREVRERFAQATEDEANRLIDEFIDAGSAELRRSFAGPLAASIMARALGLDQDEVGAMLAWYDAIVAAVTEVTEGHEVPRRGSEAFDALRARLQDVISRGPEASLLGTAAEHEDLTTEQIISNAAVLLFGGIETTEGMIANALLDLLEHPDLLAWVGHDRKRLDAALEESLRLEPAAAVVDRYATADAELRDARIRKGELVRISISAANRDPAVFADPNRFDPGRLIRSGAQATARRHLTFAHGPHVCLGVHLARLEARTALVTLIDRLPGMRIDPQRPSHVRGLVFRKPPTLHVVWNDS